MKTNVFIEGLGYSSANRTGSPQGFKEEEEVGGGGGGGGGGSEEEEQG